MVIMTIRNVEIDMDIDQLLDEYWDRIKKGDELITTIQADTKWKLSKMVGQMLLELVGEDLYIDYESKKLYGKGQIDHLESINSEKAKQRKFVPVIVRKYFGF